MNNLKSVLSAINSAVRAYQEASSVLGEKRANLSSAIAQISDLDENDREQVVSEFYTVPGIPVTELAKAAHLSPTTVRFLGTGPHEPRPCRQCGALVPETANTFEFGAFLVECNACRVSQRAVRRKEEAKRKYQEKKAKQHEPRRKANVVDLPKEQFSEVPSPWALPPPESDDNG
jgi:hypothetical protein